MSTIEEFENAPIGAAATNPDGQKIYRKSTKTPAGLDWVRKDGDFSFLADADDLAYFGYTLNHVAPTTAREALALAWELAPPVKEGQTMPSGTEYLLRHGPGYDIKVSLVALSIDGIDAESIRTLDPLPDPEPDWLDAPAVLAHTDNDHARRVWTARRDEQWASTSHAYTRHWRDLRDVTPLYPKEDA